MKHFANSDNQLLSTNDQKGMQNILNHIPIWRNPHSDSQESMISAHLCENCNQYDHYREYSLVWRILSHNHSLPADKRKNKKAEKLSRKNSRQNHRLVSAANFHWQNNRLSCM